jgi:hypothetical protein
MQREDSLAYGNTSIGPKMLIKKTDCLTQRTRNDGVCFNMLNWARSDSRLIFSASSKRKFSDRIVGMI